MKSCLKRRLQTGTALICSLAMAFSVLPVSAEESTQSLESKTSDLAGQLAGINQELVAISDQISTTEMQVEITNGEITNLAKITYEYYPSEKKVEVEIIEHM